jgi:hypothetical protein
MKPPEESPETVTSDTLYCFREGSIFPNASQIPTQAKSTINVFIFAAAQKLETLLPERRALIKGTFVFLKFRFFGAVAVPLSVFCKHDKHPLTLSLLRHNTLRFPLLSFVFAGEEGIIVKNEGRIFLIGLLFTVITSTVLSSFPAKLSSE